MKEPCTLYQRAIEYEQTQEGNDECPWDCKLHPNDADEIDGIFVSFEGLCLPANAKDNNGNKLMSGESTLFAEGIQLKRGQAKARLPDDATPKFGRRPSRPRNLAQTTGTKNVLVVRVKGADKNTTSSMAEISNSVFGTDGDPVNLKSQFAACSFGQVNITPAIGSTYLRSLFDCDIIEYYRFLT
jgi:hypothetical protein